MARRIVAVAVALVFAIGCTGSDGSQGPKGDKGDPGEPGARGDPGEPGAAGTSVVASSLPPGDPNCPSGGSQFVSASGTTYACNGAQGSKGDPGQPRVVLKANGAAVGPAFPVVTTGASAIALYVPQGAFVLVDPATGRSVLSDYVYFTEPGCVGDAYVAANGRLQYAFEATGWARVFVATSATEINFYSQSWMRPNPINGSPMCDMYYTSGRTPGYAVSEITAPVFPLQTPISLAYE